MIRIIFYSKEAKLNKLLDELDYKLYNCYMKQNSCYSGSLLIISKDKIFEDKILIIDIPPFEGVKGYRADEIYVDEFYTYNENYQDIKERVLRPSLLTDNDVIEF